MTHLSLKNLDLSRRCCCGALLMAALVALAVTPAGPARAQTGGPYEITRHRIAGGGATLSSGGGYEQAGTIGQYDAGAMTGGPVGHVYGVIGGFQVRPGVAVFVPVVLRQ